MGDYEITLEIPGGVTQQDLWDLEDELRQTEGVAKVNLTEKRDLISVAVLAIGLVPVAAGYVKQGVETAANISAAARKLHEFLHQKDKKSEADEAARKKAVLKFPDGTSAELYGYSEAELVTVLTKALPESKQ